MTFVIGPPSRAHTFIYPQRNEFDNINFLDLTSLGCLMPGVIRVPLVRNRQNQNPTKKGEKTRKEKPPKRRNRFQSSVTQIYDEMNRRR